MTVRDLVAEFAGLAAGDDLTRRWQERVVAPHAELFAAIRPWVDPGRAGAALPGLVARRDELLRNADRARSAIQQALALLEADVPAVVLVGLGTANGWSAEVDGEPTLFLAVDVLPEPGYDVVLAVHELAHVLHQRRAARDWPEDRVDADLLREGLAVQTTSALLPEIEPSGHLWFAPGHEGWIDRCRSIEPLLRRRALAELVRGDLGSEWFSGRADRPGELPGRCGYWLGGQLMAELGAPFDEVAGWSLEEGSRRLRKSLEGTG